MNYNGLSLLWALLRHPVTDGPRLIKEYGTVQKGLIAYAIFALVSLIIMVTVMPVGLVKPIGFLAGLGATTYMVLLALFGFVVITVYSAVFSLIIRGMKGATTFSNTFMNLSFLYALSAALNDVNSIVKFGIFNGVGIGDTITTIISVAINIYCIIAGLHLFSYQTGLSKWGVFGAALLTHVAIVIVATICSLVFIFTTFGNM